ncbi:MAG: cytochrome c biogenesis protein ResB [Thermodesulfobacteriaceae bacterium]|nr:cytochrome c biogenesis protein ResB [Thermodesulfobacteriaceae bacterium]
MKKFLNFLGSVKVAIFLFLILTILSIFGTFIPQGQPEEFYLFKYGKRLGKILLFFNFDDAYHSWWYIFFLFLFFINLLICSINRLKTTWKLYQKSPLEVNLESLPLKRNFLSSVEYDLLVKYLQEKLKFIPTSKKGLFCKDQNRWSHFSFYLVHLSWGVILLGALVGAIWGYRGNMSILEGESSNYVIPFRKRDPIYIDFSIKLNQFILEFYPNGMPKEYISNVTVIDGNYTFNALIKVNEPLKYKDLTFYQSSYNELPEFKIKVENQGKIHYYTLSLHAPAVLEESKYLITLEDYGVAHGFLFAKISILDENTGDQSSGFLIKGFRPLQVSLNSEKNLRISLEEVERVWYVTGLQVKKDPGRPLVYIGFILMILGVLLVYFFEPKTLWIYLETEKKGTKVILGGYSKRERGFLRLELETLEKKLQNLK